MPQVQVKYRDQLIKRIQSINDKDVLDDINRLLEVDIDDSTYVTSEDQKSEVATAKKQIDSGKGISSEQADNEIDQWLSK